MALHEVEVLAGGAGLGELAAAGLALVCGALEVELLVVGHDGREEVVHHNDTNVHTTTLEGGREGGREGGEGGEGGREGDEEEGIWQSSLCWA